MEKILTIVIPSYNVEQYLRETLDSFMDESVMDKIEVLIVNDGSKDSTPQIGKEYEEKYPNTFRLIDKENGGHGSTINRGIQEAVGKYFKVVDGDDWVNTPDFAEMVRKLENCDADYVVCNYFKVNDQTKEKTVVDFPYLKEHPKCAFDEVAGNVEILMHALTIKTSILKDNNIRLDEHCFYVDNEYIIFPIPYVETVEYFDLTVYMYRLALATQSVSIQGFQKHLDNHVKVAKRLIDFSVEFAKTSDDKKKIEYLYNRTANMIGDQARIFASFPAGNQEIKKQFMEFDQELKEKSPALYELSGSRSKVLNALRKSGFKNYAFWTKMSKIKMKMDNK